MVTNSIKAGFFEISMNGMLAIDSNGIIICANESAYYIFGYIPDELEGRSLSILLPEEYRERHDAHIKSFMEHPKKRIMGKTDDGITLEIFGQTKKGEKIALQVNISGKYHQDASGVIGYATFLLK